MIISDKEFGEIVVRRNTMIANGCKFSVGMDGRLQMTVPKYAKDFIIRRYLETNRANIRKNLKIKDPATQRTRDAQKKILMKKAKEYLPYRLEYFAKLYGYRYDHFRVSHASTRWGSCTRHGKDGSITISLNIGLMNVPEILRDYVILHELAHINHMDHSPAFWLEVGAHDPRYREHRRKLKMFSPAV